MPSLDIRFWAIDSSMSFLAFSEFSLYPLDDFSVRKTENIQKGYLNGRYGAIPFISTGYSLWED